MLSSLRPPIHRREFWATQLLVLTIAVGHSVLEFSGQIQHLGPLDFMPITFFLFPVLYAGLNFGLAGAAATALWCAVISIPNVLLWHQGLEVLAETWQAALVVFVGIFVGERIDLERRAREDAEKRDNARRRSEDKYRNLFDTIPDPILLLDNAGVVAEANQAAASLFGAGQDALRGRPVTSLVGSELADMLAGGVPRRVAQMPGDAAASTRWVEPLIAAVGGDGGHLQVVLRDVTLQHEREEGLQTYTRRTFSTREEERRRIARDLHDGPLQSVVLLARQLDAVEPGISGSARPQLVGARRLADEIADELRRFSRELRPSILDDLGIGPAARAEVHAVARRSRIAVIYAERGEAIRLGSETELTLLRILQEALHNTERHAAASMIRVRLAFMKQAVRLVVTDDGAGIPRGTEAADLLAAGKLGLVGMRERARLAGGDVTIRSRRSRGTIVCAWLPTRGGIDG